MLNKTIQQFQSPDLATFTHAYNYILCYMLCESKYINSGHVFTRDPQLWTT